MNVRPTIIARSQQTITVTAQVIQSIKLLQYSRDELQEFLQENAERNPLIELADGNSVRRERTPARDPAPAAGASRTAERPLGSGARSGAAPISGGLRSLEDYCASAVSLREQLQTQVAVALRDPADRIIASEIVGSIDADGYLRRELFDIAQCLGVSEDMVERVLETVQTFEPAGIAGRDLAECLSLQLRERGRLDDPMRVLLENLPLLASYNVSRLARLCRVDAAKVVEMAHELRTLDPRPGRRFDSSPTPPALPDVRVQRLPDGTFTIDLDTEFLPSVLVNRAYYAELSANCTGKDEKKFISDCMRNASWLENNLDQRAQTILKVATEIVARQRNFFTHGAEQLRPLSLKDVADAVGLHESTVCRAIANKYMMTDRGMFELKFFFTNSIPSTNGGEDFSAETIRNRIRQLVSAETASSVMSDDAIMAELRGDGIDIARRTVAKYREMMNIPSSMQRRRQKLLHAAA